MADKLLLIIANADPYDPAATSAPLLQATVAAAMDYEVEVILSGRAGELAITGFADQLRAPGTHGKSLYTLIEEAHAAGVRFKLCSNTLERLSEPLIPQIEETVGSAYIVSEAMDADTVTLTY